MNSNLHINFDPTYPLGQDEGRLERIDLHVLPVHFKETAAFFFRHHIVLIHDPKEQAHGDDVAGGPAQILCACIRHQLIAQRNDELEGDMKDIGAFVGSKILDDFGQEKAGSAFLLSFKVFGMIAHGL